MEEHEIKKERGNKKGICEVCGKSFLYYASESSGKYCSRKCWGVTCVKNLGNRFKGKKWSAEHREKVIEATTGEKHWAWCGDSISYIALHRWVERHRGKPQKCEHCGTTEKGWYDWANISGEYKRDLNDFIRLCRKCHRAYDKKRHIEKVGTES
ncbi:MAG: hypothetical protein KAS04_01230 [Candidatus Aenigmarchaeota archaeon]|nr:hypothetical protein [Candidatus Aenigmarchaeota archaeon]